MKNKQSLSRRNFLQWTGLGLAGSVIPSSAFSAFFSEKWNPAKLSVQLYTVRDQIKADIPGTLKRVRDIGFNYVETAFWPDGISVQQAASYLKDAGRQGFFVTYRNSYRGS